MPELQGQPARVCYGGAMDMSPRPILPLTRSPAEKVWDTVAIVGLLVTVLLAVYTFAFVQGPVPTHFNAAGEPDAFGSKGVLLLLLIPAVSATALFAGLRGVPHTFNYPVPITPENAERQYRLGRELLASVGAGLAWTMAAVALSIAGTAAGWFPEPGPLLLLFIVTATMGPVASGLYRSYRAR